MHRSRPLGGESETLVIGVYIFSSCLTRNQTSACTVQRPTPRRSQDTPTYKADYKQCSDFSFVFFERNRIKSRTCTKTGRAPFRIRFAYFRTASVLVVAELLQISLLRGFLDDDTG